MTWEAVEPRNTRRNEFYGSVREHTMIFPCHEVWSAQAGWHVGSHRTAAAALGCAESEAKRRNRTAQ